MKYTFKNRDKYSVKKACEEFNFICPRTFWKMSDEEILTYWNGMGAEGDWKNKFIPDTIYGVNVTLASCPHDVAFAKGNTKKHFHMANLYFFFNLLQIVRKFHTGKIMRFLGCMRAAKYYFAVASIKGYEAFLKAKK